MAIQDFPEFYIPSWEPRNAGRTPTHASYTLDAAGKKAALVTHAHKTVTISKVGFRTGTVTTNGDVDVRIETVDATTGDPTGTLFGTTTNGTVTVNAANSWFTATLTAGASITQGTDRIAVVIVNTTGSYLISSNDVNLWQSNLPYGDVYNNVSWAKQTSTPIVALEESGGAYSPIPGIFPALTYSAVAANTGSTPDEVGLYFTPSVTCRAKGFGVYADLDADADMVLYDSDGTSVLTSLSLDKDVRQQNAAGLILGNFPARPTLNGGSIYRLIFKPTTGTNTAIYQASAGSAAVLGAFPAGTGYQRTERTDAGAWTQTTTLRPLIFLLVDGIDVPSSGGPGRIWSPVQGRGRVNV